MRWPLPTVCLFGPESTGKTTLARALAGTFGTVFVPEYGRYYCEAFGNECDVEDLRAIARGQKALEDAARRKAKTILILDTDRVMTAIWADVLLGHRPADLDTVERPADLYLLADVDVPFQHDAIRYFPDQQARQRFLARCRSELEKRRLPFVLLQGNEGARLAQALAAIDAELGVKASE
jgi:HTH-type transcriptional repressor of NAD biosynthesis genes